jgi:hypothetical protein
MSAPQAGAGLTLAQIREQQKALREQAKTLKALSDGKISAVAVLTPEETGAGETFPNGAVSIDIALGQEKRTAQDGREYLFSADPVKFTHNGVEYITSAIYAIATSKPKA